MRTSFMLAVLAAWMAAPAWAGSVFDGKPAASTVQRGSLLVFPDVEVKYDANQELVMDTFIEITNDSNNATYVQLYFVNGDDPILDEVLSGTFPPILLERTHPGCNFVDTQIWLSPNKSTFFSSATGNNNGGDTIQVPPFGNLDPDPAAEGSTDFVGDGRPDKDFPEENQRTVRGFVLAWAVNVQGLEITHDYLTGSALKVDYGNSAAWEYDATAFRRGLGDDLEPCADCATPMVPISDGFLMLDGWEYEPAPARLELDFYSVTTDILSANDTGLTIHDTDISLLPMRIDLTNYGERRIAYTRVQADIWNQNEIRFSGAERCICCWDQTLLRNFQGMGNVTGNHFLRENIATDKGKARLTGMPPFGCEFDGVVFDEVVRGTEGVEVEPLPPVSLAGMPLLGVATKILQFGDDIDYAGATLTFEGNDLSGAIYHHVVAPAQSLQEKELTIVEPARTTLSRRAPAPVKDTRVISPR